MLPRHSFRRWLARLPALSFEAPAHGTAAEARWCCMPATAAYRLLLLCSTNSQSRCFQVIYTKRSATDCQDVGIVAGFDWPQRAPAGGATAAAAAVAAALRRHLPAGPPPLNLIPALIMRLPAKLLGKGRRAAKGGATGRPKLQHEVSITSE